MVKFYCTAGRGTETFVKKEIEKQTNAHNVCVTDGKVYFESSLSDYHQIANLKTVERVFICILKTNWNDLTGRYQKHIKEAVVRRELWESDDILAALDVLQKDRKSQVNTSRKESRLEDDCDPPVNKVPKLIDSPTFRMICRCTGKKGRKIDPLNLQRDVGIGIKKLLGWKVDLRSPEIEISVHVSDDGVVVGIPITRVPISKRSYIKHFGLRSTIAYIMSSLLPFQTGDVILDPMCGKATILVESAYKNKTVTYLGCDRDIDQLISASDNIEFAQLQNVHLFHGNATGLPLASCSIDHIVCDAPFGNKFVVDLNLKDFYSNLLNELTRVLKPKGRIVLLTSPDIRQYLTSLFVKGDNLEVTSNDKDKNTSNDKVYTSDCKNNGPNSETTCCEQENDLTVSDNNELGYQGNKCISQSESENNQRKNQSSTKCELEYKSCLNDGENLDRKIISTPITDKCESLVEDKCEKLVFYKLLLLVESHYVKLGETDAYICVFDKSV